MSDYIPKVGDRVAGRHICGDEYGLFVGTITRLYEKAAVVDCRTDGSTGASLRIESLTPAPMLECGVYKSGTEPAVDRAKAPEPEVYGTMPAELPETLTPGVTARGSHELVRRNHRETYYVCRDGQACCFIHASDIDWEKVPRQPSHPQPVAEGDRLHTGRGNCCLCGAEASLMRADKREYCWECKESHGGIAGAYREIDRRVALNGQQAQSKPGLVPTPPPDPYSEHRLRIGEPTDHSPARQKQYGNGDALDRLAAIRRRKIEQLRGEMDRKAPSAHPRSWPESAFLEAEESYVS